MYEIDIVCLKVFLINLMKTVDKVEKTGIIKQHGRKRQVDTEKEMK